MAEQLAGLSLQEQFDLLTQQKNALEHDDQDIDINTSFLPSGEAPGQGSDEEPEPPQHALQGSGDSHSTPAVIADQSEGSHRQERPSWDVLDQRGGSFKQQRHSRDATEPAAPSSRQQRESWDVLSPAEPSPKQHRAGRTSHDQAEPQSRPHRESWDVLSPAEPSPKQHRAGRTSRDQAEPQSRPQRESWDVLDQAGQSPKQQRQSWDVLDQAPTPLPRQHRDSWDVLDQPESSPSAPFARRSESRRSHLARQTSSRSGKPSSSVRSAAEVPPLRLGSAGAADAGCSVSASGHKADPAMIEGAGEWTELSDRCQSRGSHACGSR